MIAFPGMLISAAEQAGMRVPADPDKFDKDEYPHFNVFCNAQLGQAMPRMGCHWDNAKVIAAIPDDKIMEVTWQDLIAAGFCVAFN